MPVERQQRARSFGSVAGTYDRFRPGPPLSAVDWILRTPCGTAADLGAGTGALTRVLGQRADRVIAVEPDARMVQVLRQRSPEAWVLRATAEGLPLGAGVLDAALISSAWHWMDPERTITGRVLRPGAILGILWNGADRSVEWVSQLLGTQDPSPGDARDRRTRHRFELPPSSPFGELETSMISWSTPVTGEELVGLAGTYSSVITMAPDEREEELAWARSSVEALVAGDVIQLPMACRCWRAVRA